MLQEDCKFRLFVGGLHSCTNESSMDEYFNRFGPVRSTFIKRNEEHRSKGYGMVTFMEAEGFEATLNTPEHYLDGKKIDPKEFDYEAWTVGRSAENKIFVGGLSPLSTEEDVRRYFGQLGPLQSVQLKKDPVSGVSRKYAFVTFKSACGVEDVLNLKRHVVNGKQVDVKPFREKQGQIFVGGLNYNCTYQEIAEYFGQYGEIIKLSLPVLPQSPKQNKGYCFITYKSEIFARKCLSSVTVPVICGKVVDVKLALPQGTFQRENELQLTREVTQSSGCPYCGGPGPVINPPLIFPPVPLVSLSANVAGYDTLHYPDAKCNVGEEFYDTQILTATNRNTVVGKSRMMIGTGTASRQNRMKPY